MSKDKTSGLLRAFRTCGWLVKSRQGWSEGVAWMPLVGQNSVRNHIALQFSLLLQNGESFAARRDSTRKQAIPGTNVIAFVSLSLAVRDVGAANRGLVVGYWHYTIVATLVELTLPLGNAVRVRCTNIYLRFG